ncbi:MAG: 2-C-methyl-D-erythritol 4-phosphate cytidylyltransferase, partial [Alphaproteobacteria bacterium]|nr:2-C-methyl-D-erythritol 4-phosphate cytidylyltransferase [Alphaproteobacteria bacterium]
MIVAAGAGTRLGGVPKQYRELAGEPVLRRTIEAFTAHPDIGGVKVVINSDHTPLYEQAVHGLTLLPPALGGETRQQSVRNGLEALLVERAPANVLIHDAARPFVSAQLIQLVLEGLKQHSAV